MAVLRFFRRWFFYTLLSAVILIAVVGYLASTEKRVDEGSLVTEHFVFVYKDLTSSDASIISKDIEKERSRIMLDLGVEEMPNIVVYLYSEEHSEFEELRTEKDGALGFVTIIDLDRMYIRESKGLAYTMVHPKIVQHEFTHLVVNNMLYQDALKKDGVRNRVDWIRSCSFNADYCTGGPSWLTEAVAMYESNDQKGFKERYWELGSSFDVTKLNREDQYMFGYVIAEYIVDSWGMDGLRDLLRARSDTQSTFGVSIEDFNNGFRAFIATKYGF